MAVARAALAAATLAWFLFGPTAAFSALFYVLAVFLVCAVVLAIKARAPHGVFGLLALIADIVYLLVSAAYGGERLVWFSTAFLLYVLAEALVFFGVTEVVLVSVVAAAFCIALPSLPLEPLLRTILVGGTLACGAAIYKSHMTTRLATLEARAAGAQQDAEKARETERQRIAADFHDGPLQSFISLQMRLEILKKLLERDFEAGMEELLGLQSLAVAQIRDLRMFLNAMRPVDVDGANFVVTARRTAESFQKESGIPVTFISSSGPVGLPPEMTAEALQMIREALANVQKHANATRVAVSLEKAANGLEISIEDNGHGFAFSGSYSLEELELLRLGPASLKRRARSLNADMQLESRPGRGTGLKVRIPLQ
ncbi:MAG: sensor histidine kinase [Bryobacteraceae bacterium]|jgi:signal transduction histidine kinase